MNTIKKQSSLRNTLRPQISRFETRNLIESMIASRSQREDYFVESTIRKQNKELSINKSIREFNLLKGITIMPLLSVYPGPELQVQEFGFLQREIKAELDIFHFGGVEIGTKKVKEHAICQTDEIIPIKEENIPNIEVDIFQIFTLPFNSFKDQIGGNQDKNNVPKVEIIEEKPKELSIVVKREQKIGKPLIDIDLLADIDDLDDLLNFEAKTPKKATLEKQNRFLAEPSKPEPRPQQNKNNPTYNNHKSPNVPQFKNKTIAKNENIFLSPKLSSKGKKNKNEEKIPVLFIDRLRPSPILLIEEKSPILTLKNKSNLFSDSNLDKKMRQYLSILYKKVQKDIKSNKISWSLDLKGGLIIPEEIYNQLESDQELSFYKKFDLKEDKIEIVKTLNRLIFDSFNQLISHIIHMNYKSDKLEDYILSEVASKAKKQIKREIKMRKVQGDLEEKYTDEPEVSRLND